MNDWLNNDTTYTAASATPNAVASSGAVGTSSKYAREDHTHAISVGSGDSNGQVKIAGQNASVTGLGSAAYTNSTDYAASGHNHDSTYLKLSGGTVTGAITLSTALLDSRFASTNQQILNVDGGDNTTRNLYIGNPTNVSDIYFETKNSVKNVASIVTVGSEPTFNGVHVGNQDAPYIYAENGNINFRYLDNESYNYANIKDLAIVHNNFDLYIMDSNARVRPFAGNLNDISVTSIYNFDVANVTNYPADASNG